MHRHTQLNSFEDSQEASIEVQQRLEAKKISKTVKLHASVKPTFLEDTTPVHSH
jgi:hypothetical protein